MSWLDKLRRVIAPPAADERYQSLLLAVIEELKHHHPWEAESHIAPSEAYRKIRNLSEAEKAHFLLYLLKNQETAPDEQVSVFFAPLILRLFQQNLALTAEDCRMLAAKYLFGTRHYFPVGYLVQKIEQLAEREGLPKTLIDLVQKALEQKKYHGYQTQQNLQLDARLAAILEKAQPLCHRFQLEETDAFGQLVNRTVSSLPADVRKAWGTLFQRFLTANGGKPTAKWLKSIFPLRQAIGETAYVGQVHAWLEAISKMDTHIESQTRWYTAYAFLSAGNQNIAKGMVWSIGPEVPAGLQQLLAKLLIKGYEKIPNVGPKAASLANACAYVLANQPTLSGVALLSQAKLKIQQRNAQALIGKNIHEAAARFGIRPGEIEDLAVPSYGLDAGHQFTRVFEGGYRATATLLPEGKLRIAWQKPDCTPLKSEPAAVKQLDAAPLRDFKSTAKQIQATFSAQRERLDRFYREARQMGWPYFDQHFLQHPLLSVLVERLIWTFQEAGQQTLHLIRQGGQWVNAQARPGPFHPGTKTKVSLWHPVGQPLNEIVAWRDFLQTHQVHQPVKQAYREVYLLTEAELHTRTYSNRMAAHILKQFQFNSLAKLRGWKYALVGNYDHGRNTITADLALPVYGLRAEFWINELYDANDSVESGIWNYIGTDQLRFYRLHEGGGDPIPLTDVPPVAFSEVMRDADLFVGVGSIGNDPNWQNSGNRRFDGYWQSYSFGDLGEVAKTRRQVLERLLPKLNIAKVSEIRDKFLVVKGKIRTYKIHLGSTNILMEPNDQYLCIVPDRKAAGQESTDLFLPFEGDSGLSVILSKALLLAADDKITDSSITSQIGRA